ncbi:hypothetical protein GQ42DRAFT_162342 [Ramicandelaber brevisporus]|nr:hypothetical protein GQ42DRAFT_162342 [Ramicandelaber brevisporus]
MRDDEEQLNELKQQQPTLPLLYLPVELAEEISLYFEGRDAAKLLRVSRSFHSLFLPRVWVDLNTFIVIKDDEMKRHMIERYGHFVRRAEINSYNTTWFKLDWLPFVKRITYLKVGISFEGDDEEAEMLMESIKQSKMLRTLDLHVDSYHTALEFDKLAAAINELEYLERITCEFRTECTGVRGSGWRRAANFVDLLRPSMRSKLKLKMKIETTYNEMDVRTLAPYFIKLEIYQRMLCNTYLAHEFFGIKDNDGQPLVFPQLKQFRMTSCCFKSEGYTVESIKPSRFPQLQHLHFNSGSCDFERFNRPNENEYEKYNWKPEYSGYSHIIVPSQRWQHLICLQIGIVSSSILMDIIDIHPRLQRLRIESEYFGSFFSNAPIENDASKYNHDEFQLDDIIDCLPHLVEFSIEQLNSRIVVSPAAVPATRRNSIDIFIGCHMSITPSAAVYIMQIPRLKNASFIYCTFVDMDETINLLQGDDEKVQKFLKCSVSQSSDATGWEA